MRFLDRTDPKYLVSWHQPLNGVDSDGAKDKGLMRRLAKNLDLPKKPLVCGGACHGTMSCWFNRHHAGAAITVEYGSKARSMARMKGRDADGVLAAIGGRRGDSPLDPAGRSQLLTPTNWGELTPSAPVSRLSAASCAATAGRHPANCR